MPDVTLGELRLLVSPAIERLRHAHPGAGVLTVTAPSGTGTPTAVTDGCGSPMCGAQVAAVMSDYGVRVSTSEAAHNGPICIAYPDDVREAKGCVAFIAERDLPPWLITGDPQRQAHSIPSSRAWCQS